MKKGLMATPSGLRIFELITVREQQTFVSPGFVPQSKLYAVPEPQLVIDGAEIVFDDVLGGSNFFGDFSVFESLGNEFDDSLLSLIWCSTRSPSEHSCLLYRSVASLTRLTPPVMPKRTNKRLKCAFTVRRAIFNCLEISSLSQPCKSSSTTCRSLGRNDLSSMGIPLR